MFERPLRRAPGRRCHDRVRLGSCVERAWSWALKVCFSESPQAASGRLLPMHEFGVIGPLSKREPTQMTWKNHHANRREYGNRVVFPYADFSVSLAPRP